jgi:Domain of unknown function (DUF892)
MARNVLALLDALGLERVDLVGLTGAAGSGFCSAFEGGLWRSTPCRHGPPACCRPGARRGDAGCHSRSPRCFSSGSRTGPFRRGPFASRQASRRPRAGTRSGGRAFQRGRKARARNRPYAPLLRPLSVASQAEAIAWPDPGSRLRCPEHLEIAAYEQLMRVAQRAGDEEGAHLAERTAREERAAAAALRPQFEPAAAAPRQTDPHRPPVDAAPPSPLALATRLHPRARPHPSAPGRRLTTDPSSTTTPNRPATRPTTTTPKPAAQPPNPGPEADRRPDQRPNRSTRPRSTRRQQTGAAHRWIEAKGLSR